MDTIRRMTGNAKTLRIESSESIRRMNRIREILGLRRIRVSRAYLFHKRMLDITLSLFFLLLMAPFFALTLCIRLVRPGPCIERLKFVGRYGRLMTVLRLTAAKHSQPSCETPGSVRRRKMNCRSCVHRIKALLQMLSAIIRHYPCLVSVLAGQTSLVGPKPLKPDECDKLESWALLRYDAKPGLTGPWLVGPGMHISQETVSRIDVRYLKERNVRTDLRILLRTADRFLRSNSFRSGRRFE